MGPVVWILAAALGVVGVMFAMGKFGSTPTPVTIERQDARGNPNPTRLSAPDQHNDALGTSIAGAVDSAFKLASQIFSAVNTQK